MHKQTTETIESCIRAIAGIVAADPALQLLQRTTDGLIREGGEYITSGYGTPELELYGVNEVKEVAPILRELRKNGFRRESKPVQNAEANTLKFSYIKDEVTVKIKLHFSKGEEAVCRYVKVGEKTVDVLELKCGPELAEYDA